MARVGAERLGDDRGKLPIGQMRGEAEDRVAARRHRVVADLGFQRVGDDVGCLPAEIGDAELVEMSELDRDAAEIVPHAGEDFFDLILGLLRKGGAQILAPDAMLGQERSDPAHEGAGEIGAAPSVKALDRAQEAGDDRADDRIQKKLCAAPLGHQRARRIRTRR